MERLNYFNCAHLRPVLHLRRYSSALRPAALTSAASSIFYLIYLSNMYVLNFHYKTFCVKV